MLRREVVLVNRMGGAGEKTCCEGGRGEIRGGVGGQLMGAQAGGDAMRMAGRDVRMMMQRGGLEFIAGAGQYYQDPITNGVWGTAVFGKQPTLPQVGYPKSGSTLNRECYLCLNRIVDMWEHDSRIFGL